MSTTDGTGAPGSPPDPWAPAGPPASGQPADPPSPPLPPAPPLPPVPGAWQPAAPVSPPHAPQHSAPPQSYAPPQQGAPPYGPGPYAAAPNLVVRRYPPVLPIQGRRPPLWIFLLIVAALLAHSVWLWVRYGPSGDATSSLSSRLWTLEIALAAGVVLITVLGRWSRSVGWVPRRGTAPAVPIIAIAVSVTAVALLAASGADLGWAPTRYALLLVNCLAVGVFEETMFRGLLWASLPERWSASRVLLVTSVSFGALHLANGFVTGRWGVAVAQACFVSFAGLGLGAVRMRSGWLGLGVVTHMLIDASLMAAGASVTRAQDLDPSGRHVPVLVLLLMLAFLCLYITLAVAGFVVLVRTFRSERQLRRLAAWFPGGAGPSPSWPPGPPTLVG